MKHVLRVCLCLLVTSVAYAAPGVHQTALSWTQSTSTDVDHDCVYRGQTKGGPYVQIFCSPAKTPITAYLDLTVKGGQTYYFVTTAVSSVGTESNYSNETQAVIPQDELPNTNLQSASQ